MYCRALRFVAATLWQLMLLSRALDAQVKRDHDCNDHAHEQRCGTRDWAKVGTFIA